MGDEGVQEYINKFTNRNFQKCSEVKEVANKDFTEIR